MGMTAFLCLVLHRSRSIEDAKPQVSDVKICLNNVVQSAVEAGRMFSRFWCPLNKQQLDMGKLKGAAILTHLHKETSMAMGQNITRSTQISESARAACRRVQRACIRDPLLHVMKGPSSRNATTTRHRYLFWPLP